MRLVAKSARCAVALVSCASFCTVFCSPAINAEPADGDGIAPAIVTESGERNVGPKAGPYDADAPVRPHWCNKTSTLIDDIHRLGGYSVMRADIGEGRVLERYWNASEEVVIEHGTDGTSCLVDLRRR